MKKVLQKIARLFLIGFVLANIVAFLHAYRFTHFSDSAPARTADPKELSFGKKLATLFTGIDNPRPANKETPTQPYTVEYVNSSEQLECWRINVPDAKGTILLFHGYAGKKSSLIRRAEIFQEMGFNTILIDFMGSGGSAGSSTSIGYAEAEQVKYCMEAFREEGKSLFLFGTSMGAVAILKALHDYDLSPEGIILECPFGSLYKTVCARFELMHVPAFPMAALLTFWGGVQHGYWGFTHNPSEYAHAVACPTLLMFGEKDDRVTLEETNEIFEHLKGKKILKTYAQEGHDVFGENEEAWRTGVEELLNGV